MPNVKELIAQREALDQQIIEAQRQAKVDGTSAALSRFVWNARLAQTGGRRALFAV